jgi:hypothetical protein
MEEHIIRKEDGTIVKWNKTKNNGYFCLLHNDNKQKYSFSPIKNLKCQLFMIGGGGAGGYFFGGGGGAGAAYINNNYLFEKNNSYSFEIGIGGKCDIDNINNLFKSGLNLKVFNNTTPKLDNISFTYDDYTSLGINTGGIVQSFTVNSINIPSTIFNNNTTYIWDGYIKPNNSGFIKININSKIKTMVWVDKFIFNNSSAIVDGININDVKVIQLDSNKFYNVKIIAYNFDTSNSNFNISFENCQLYNFDKNGEIYNYTPATDTNLFYRNNNDNIPNVIKCKGGGFGGCGLYNQNNNLDGGCGGGSGINKKNGKAIVDPTFNGNDGAIGAYCGGGGGIISPGNNDKGGNGKIIEWFSNDLIFGAGGNAATFKETRNLGYGCGGNGAECCYFSKLLINNDGNNGCILIYVDGNVNVNVNDNVNGNIIEGFGDLDAFVGKIDTYLDEESIVNTLIKESFNIIKNTNTISSSSGDDTEQRFNYYNSYGGTFTGLCTNEGPGFITKANADSVYTTALATKTTANFGYVANSLNITKVTVADAVTKVSDIFTNWASYNTGTNILISSNNALAIKDAVLSVSTALNDVATDNITGLITLPAQTSLSINTIKTKIDDIKTKAYDAYTKATDANNGYTDTKSKELDAKKAIKTAVDAINNLKKLIYDEADNFSRNSVTGTTELDNNNMNNYIYDVLIISKLYAIVYMLYYHHFTKTLNNDISRFNEFLNNVRYTFNDNATAITTSENTYIVNICKLFEFTTLKLGDTVTNYSNIYTDSTTTNLDSNIYNTYKSNIGIYPVPYYHNISDGTALNDILDITNALGNINKITTITTNAISDTITFELIGSNPLNLAIYTSGLNQPNDDQTLNKKSLFQRYNKIKSTFDIITEPTNNVYAKQRVAFYLEQFNIILNTNPSILLSTLKYKMYYYNAVVYNVILQYQLFNIQKNRLTSDYNPASPTTPANPANPATPASVVTININSNITILQNNLTSIYTSNINTSSYYTDVVSKIYTGSGNVKTSLDDFTKSQDSLNDAINKYNNDLDTYNNYSYYYKIIIAIAIVIIIFIILIFTIKSIDNNTKIMMFAFIAIIIIVLFIIYNNKLTLTTETFITCRRKYIDSNSDGSISTNINFTSYKSELYKYSSYIMLLLSTQAITKNTLYNIDTHLTNINDIRYKTIQVNNNKIKNYENASELLKKSANDYYYLIILIIFSIIILMFGMSLYLLYPTMLLNIVIFAIIPFIILVFYVMYKINRSTRMAEDKKYWSIYNPSSTLLTTL